MGEYVESIILGLLSIIMALFGAVVKHFVKKVDEHEDRMKALEISEATATVCRENMAKNIDFIQSGQTEMHQDIKKLLAK